MQTDIFMTRRDGVALDRVSGLFSGMRPATDDDNRRAATVLRRNVDRLAYHTGAPVPDQVAEAASRRLFGSAGPTDDA